MVIFQIWILWLISLKILMKNKGNARILPQSGVHWVRRLLMKPCAPDMTTVPDFISFLQLQNGLLFN